jgi:hypothetical protein
VPACPTNFDSTSAFQKKTSVPIPAAAAHPRSRRRCPTPARPLPIQRDASLPLLFGSTTASAAAVGIHDCECCGVAWSCCEGEVPCHDVNDCCRDCCEGVAWYVWIVPRCIQFQRVMFGLYPRGHHCTIFLGLFSLGNFAPLFLSVFPGLLVPCEIQHDLLAAARYMTRASSIFTSS